jgi:hypothetical protein
MPNHRPVRTRYRAPHSRDVDDARLYPVSSIETELLPKSNMPEVNDKHVTCSNLLEGKNPSRSVVSWGILQDWAGILEDLEVHELRIDLGNLHPTPCLCLDCLGPLVLSGTYPLLLYDAFGLKGIKHIPQNIKKG